MKIEIPTASFCSLPYLVSVPETCASSRVPLEHWRSVYPVRDGSCYGVWCQWNLQLGTPPLAPKGGPVADFNCVILPMFRSLLNLGWIVPSSRVDFLPIDPLL